MLSLLLFLGCQSDPLPSSSEKKPALVPEKDQQGNPQANENAPVTKEQRRAEPPTGVLTDEQLAKMLRNRDVWQKPKRVIKEAGIKAGDIVADVGCGAGYWTYYLSEAVGPTGKVYAIDFDPNATSYLKKRLQEKPLKNVELVTSKSHDIMMPEDSVDHAMLVNVHFLMNADEMKSNDMSQVKEDFPDFYGSIHKALRSDGQMIFIESSKEEDVGRRVDAAQITEQLQGVQFAQKSKFDFLEPRQYFMLYSLVE